MSLILKNLQEICILLFLRHVSFVKLKNVNLSEFVTRMRITNYSLSHENAVSFRERTQTCISMMFLLVETIAMAKPSLREMSLSLSQSDSQLVPGS